MSVKQSSKLGLKLRELAQNNKPKLMEILSQLSDEEAMEILYDWSIWRRPSQWYDPNREESIQMWLCGRGSV